MSAAQDYSGVAVAVPTSTPRPRTTRHDPRWFMGCVLGDLVRTSGIAKSEIDGLVVASYGLSPDNAASLAEHFRLSPRYIVDIPYGGASGVMSICRAARAIQMGDADIVACMAADIAPMGYGIYSNFSSHTRDHTYPLSAGGANAIFALITAAYMRKTGAQLEDFGKICIAQRANGVQHPQAMFQKPLTMEQYLGARVISDPLRLFDCVPRVCAGEGVLVMSEDRARGFGLPYARIAGAVERNNGSAGDDIVTKVGAPGDSDRLYAQAGLEPRDIRFAQIYDDYPVMVMMQLESLGFCEIGEGPKLIRDRSLTLEGDLPVNTSGGMLTLGQPGAAGGFLGLNEAVRQVTGRPLGGAVPNGKVGIVSCYGTVNYDRGVCWNAAILTGGDGP